MRPLFSLLRLESSILQGASERAWPFHASGNIRTCAGKGGMTFSSSDLTKMEQKIKISHGRERGGKLARAVIFSLFRTVSFK